MPVIDGHFISMYGCNITETPSTSHGPLVFGQLGSALSFLAACIMFTVLVTDSTSRSQVRPRLLIVLAGFDCLSAFTTFFFTEFFIVDNASFVDRLDWSDKTKAFFFLGWVFTAGSFLWTTCIACMFFLSGYYECAG